MHSPFYWSAFLYIISFFPSFIAAYRAQTKRKSLNRFINMKTSLSILLASSKGTKRRSTRRHTARATWSWAAASPPDYIQGRKKGLTHSLTHSWLCSQFTWEPHWRYCHHLLEEWNCEEEEVLHPVYQSTLPTFERILDWISHALKTQIPKFILSIL